LFLIPFRREQKFRADYLDLRDQFERAKVEAKNAAGIKQLAFALNTAHPRISKFQREASQRNELFTNPLTGDVVSSGNVARQRVSQAQPSSPVRESPFAAPAPSTTLRENHALREHTFLQQTEDSLDGFIAQGREVLDNLVDQRNILKGTQQRLLDAANTLGLTRDVIS
jgi:Golgi SNAP receptor complex protein 2